MRYLLLIALAFADSEPANWSFRNMRRSYNPEEYTVTWIERFSSTCPSDHMPVAPTSPESCAAFCRQNKGPERWHQMCRTMMAGPRKDIFENAVCVPSLSDLHALCGKNRECFSVEQIGYSEDDNLHHEVDHAGFGVIDYSAPEDVYRRMDVDDGNQIIVVGFLNSFSCKYNMQTVDHYQARMWEKEVERVTGCDWGIGVKVDITGETDLSGLYERENYDCEGPGRRLYGQLGQIGASVRCQGYTKVNEEMNPQYRVIDDDDCGVSVQQYDFEHPASPAQLQLEWERVRDEHCVNRPFVTELFQSTQGVVADEACRQLRINGWCDISVIAAFCAHECNTVDRFCENYVDFQAKIDDALDAMANEDVWIAHEKSQSLKGKLEELDAIQVTHPARHQEQGPWGDRYLRDIASSLSSFTRRLHEESRSAWQTLYTSTAPDFVNDYWSGDDTPARHCATKLLQEHYDNSSEVTYSVSGTVLEDYNLGATDFYKVSDYEVPQPFTTTVDCPEIEEYLVLYEHYCTRRNFDVFATGSTYRILGQDNVELKDHSCSEKCTGNPGDPKFCSGWSADLAGDANALCLPLEECRSVCNQISGCTGFDMDRFRTRCYMNTDACRLANNTELSDMLRRDITLDLYIKSSQNDYELAKQDFSDLVHNLNISGVDYNEKSLASLHEDGQDDWRFHFGNSFDITTGLKWNSANVQGVYDCGSNNDAPCLIQSTRVLHDNDPTQGTLGNELRAWLVQWCEEAIGSNDVAGCQSNRAANTLVTEARCRRACDSIGDCAGFLVETVADEATCQAADDQDDRRACFSVHCDLFNQAFHDQVAEITVAVSTNAEVPFYKLYEKNPKNCHVAVDGGAAAGEYPVMTSESNFDVLTNASTLDRHNVFFYKYGADQYSATYRIRTALTNPISGPDYNTDMCGWIIEQDDAESTDFDACHNKPLSDDIGVALASSGPRKLLALSDYCSGISADDCNSWQGAMCEEQCQTQTCVGDDDDRSSAAWDAMGAFLSAGYALPEAVRDMTGLLDASEAGLQRAYEVWAKEQLDSFNAELKKLQDAARVVYLRQDANDLITDSARRDAAQNEIITVYEQLFNGSRDVLLTKHAEALPRHTAAIALGAAATDPDIDAAQLALDTANGADWAAVQGYPRAPGDLTDWVTAADAQLAIYFAERAAWRTAWENEADPALMATYRGYIIDNSSTINAYYASLFSNIGWDENPSLFAVSWLAPDASINDISDISNFDPVGSITVSTFPDVCPDWAMAFNLPDSNAPRRLGEISDEFSDARYPCFKDSLLLDDGSVQFDTAKLMWTFCPHACAAVYQDCAAAIETYRGSSDRDADLRDLLTKCPADVIHYNDEAHSEGADDRGVTPDSDIPVDHTVANIDLNTLSYGQWAAYEDYAPSSGFVSPQQYNFTQQVYPEFGKTWTPLYYNWKYSCNQYTNDLTEQIESLNDASWFSWLTDVVSGSVESKCAEAQPCGDFTTCVVDEMPFRQEFKAAIESPDVTKSHILMMQKRSAAFFKNHPGNDVMADNFFDSSELHLGTPGSTWVKFVTEDQAIIDLIDIDFLAQARFEDEGFVYARALSYSEINIPETLQAQPVSNLIRVIRSDSFSATLKILVDPAMCAQDECHVMQVVDGEIGQLVTSTSVVEQSRMIFTVENAMVGDYIIVADKNECLLNNGAPACDPDEFAGACTNNFNAAPSCSCLPGYVAQTGLQGEARCVLASHFQYETDFIIRITPASPVTFGWNVRNVRVESMKEGTAAAPNAGLLKSNTAPRVAWDHSVRVADHYPHHMDDSGSQCSRKHLFGPVSGDAYWCTECYSCPKGEQGPYIEFGWSGEYDITSISIDQQEFHRVDYWHVEISQAAGHINSHVCGYEYLKAGGPGPATISEYTQPGALRCPAIFQQTSAKGAGRIDVSFGEARTYIAAELVEQLDDIAPYGTHGNMYDMASFGHGEANEYMSLMRCRQLAMNLQPSGAKVYNYYVDSTTTSGTPMKHCQLGKYPFGKGQGYYGTGKLTQGFDDYTSGQVPSYATSYSFTQSPDVKSGHVKLELTLHGSWLDKKSGIRMKIVAAGAGCGAPVAADIVGLSCRGEDHLNCVRAPVAGEDRDSAVFNRLLIRRADTDKSFDVCACVSGACHKPQSWQPVTARGPGLSIQKSFYKWSLQIEADRTVDLHNMPVVSEIPRKHKTPGEISDYDNLVVTMLVQHDLFYSDGSNPREWQVKVVAKQFGCNVDQVDSKWDCDSGMGYCAWVNDKKYGTWVQQEMEDALSVQYETFLEPEDVGEYSVCFRTSADVAWEAIPSFDDKQTLRVLPIPEDEEAAVGIFHGQQYSAQAGWSNTIKVAGVGLASSSSSRIALSSPANGFQCGNNNAWVYKACEVDGCENQERKAPVFMPELSTPSSKTQTTMPPTFTMVLKFSEDIEFKGGDKAYYLVDENNVVTTLQTSETVIKGNMAYVFTEVAAANSRQYLRIAEDIFYTKGTDLSMAALNTQEGPIEWSFSTSNIANSAPLFVVDHDMISDTEVRVVFSLEPASTPVTKYDVTVCGNDQDCGHRDEDHSQYVVHKEGCYVTSNVGPFQGTVMIFDLPSGLTDSFKITAAANVVAADGAPGKTLDFDLDLFVKQASAYGDRFDFKSSVGVSALVDNAFHFKMDLTGEVTAASDTNEFAVCFCDDQKDTTPAHPNNPDSDFWVKWTDKHRCNPHAPGSEYLTGDAMMNETAAHLCAPKCGMGCKGAGCWCDGHDDDAEDLDSRLCLPEAKCWEHCKMHNTFHKDWNKDASTDGQQACVGIDVSKDANVCYLVMDNTEYHEESKDPDHEFGNDNYHNQDTAGAVCSLVENEHMKHGKKIAGTPCMEASDYSEYAGKLWVTKRAQTELQYILTPEEPESIEVLLPADVYDDESLTANPHTMEWMHGDFNDTGFSRDRITVIDCSGTCGVSKPTTAFDDPYMHTIEFWNRNAPINSFVDVAHTAGSGSEDQIREYYPGKADEATLQTKSWSAQSFCDLIIDTHSFTIQVGHGTLSVHEYAGCKPEHAGYQHGDESSDAICGSLDFIREIVSVTGAPYVTINAADNRAYLNEAGCSDEANRHPVGEYRVLENSDVVAQPVRMLSAEEGSFARYTSWDKLLRWNRIRFNSGGKFKLCFCDSTLLDGRACSKVEDYKIEVGTIHSSGISCMLEEPRFQKLNCRQQLLGSSVCSASELPESPAPPAHVTTLLADQITLQPDAVSSKIYETCMEGGPDASTGRNKHLCPMLAHSKP